MQEKFRANIFLSFVWGEGERGKKALLFTLKFLVKFHVFPAALLFPSQIDYLLKDVQIAL